MIEEERIDGVALVRLSHGKASAMDVELCQGLIDRFAHLAGDDCRAVVLTGQGRIFCAGVDLVRAQREGLPYLGRFYPLLARVFETVLLFPKPLVTAINGHAIAGGCVLACLGDRRLMADGGGRVGVPELHVGVPFPAVALEILRDAVRPGQLEDLVYGGLTYAPPDALALGLAHELVAPEALLDRALDVARDYGSRRPEAFALSKRQLRRPALDRIRAQAQEESEVEALWATEATLEHIAAYVERTLRKG